MQALEQATIGATIAAHGRLRTYGAGELLFVEGDHSDHVYVCVDGRVRIFLTMPSGRELLVGIKAPGEEFGELSALDGRPRSASAAAVDDSVVAQLPSSRFMELLLDDSHLSVAVCQNLSAELRRANHRLVIRNSNSATVRTARMLVELSSLLMRHAGEATSYEVPITQTELAGWIGATRESTARALARFRRSGLVRTARGRIVVLDVVGLNEVASAI